MNYKALLKILLSVAALAVGTQLHAQTKTMEERLSVLEERVGKLEGKSNNSKGADSSATENKSNDNYKKGMLMSIWDMPKDLNGEKPETRPVGVMVVSKTPFSPGVIKNDNDFKKYYDGCLFFMWEGYIKVNKSGTYTFSVTLENSASYDSHLLYAGILIDGKFIAKSGRNGEFLDRRILGKEELIKTSSLGGDIDLDPGYHTIAIPLECSSKQQSKGNYATLSMSIGMLEPNARRPKTLTADDLFYIE